MSAYRLACARESIAAAEKKLGKPSFLKAHLTNISNVPSKSKEMHPVGHGEEGASTENFPVKKLTPTQVEDYRKKGLVLQG